MIVNLYVSWLAQNCGVGFAVYTSCLYSLTLLADFLYSYTIGLSTPTTLLVFLMQLQLFCSVIQFLFNSLRPQWVQHTRPLLHCLPEFAQTHVTYFKMQ